MILGQPELAFFLLKWIGTEQMFDSGKFSVVQKLYETLSKKVLTLSVYIIYM